MRHASSSLVDSAEKEVLAWLRESHRNPLFLHDHPGPEAKSNEEIVARFLSWVEPTGFSLEAVNDGADEHPEWTGHWSWRGDRLVGFKQPPYAEHREDALVLACAALLQNEWCRARLP